MLAVLVVAFLVAAPFAAQLSGASMRATAHQTQLAQQAAWHEVTAVVLKPASGSQAGGWGVADAPVLARWTAPDGTVITGQVPEPPGTVAGAKVPVWVTRAGQLANPPLLGSQVSDLVLVTQLLSVAGPRDRVDRHRPAGPLGAGQAADGRLGCRLAGNRAAMDSKDITPGRAGCCQRPERSGLMAVTGSLGRRKTGKRQEKGVSADATH
jgi:hypothetical protein